MRDGLATFDNKVNGVIAKGGANLPADDRLIYLVAVLVHPLAGGLFANHQTHIGIGQTVILTPADDHLPVGLAFRIRKNKRPLIRTQFQLPLRC